MEFFRKVIISLCFAACITSAHGKCTLLQDGSITCSVESDKNLAKEIATSIQGKRNIFKVFTLSNFESKSLSKDSIGSMTFTKIILTDNPSLTNISSKAFLGSAGTATSFEIWDSPNLETRCAFEVTNKMRELVLLQFETEGLSDVPKDAFESNKKLSQILLSNNKISGFKASLAGLSLVGLHLANNKLKVDSFSVGVFKGIKKLDTLNLINNKEMKTLRQDVFQSILKSGTEIHVGRSDPTAKSYMTCQGQGWLCQYKSQLHGYKCGDIDDDLSGYCSRPHGV